MKYKKLTDTAHPPTKTNTFDAGWDLYADETVAIAPGHRQVISTGIALDIPQGFVGLIWPRSGLAANWSLQVLGGVVDSGYQGEVKVILYNGGPYTFTALKGDRVAQIVFQSVLLGGMFEVEDFDERTTRGNNGFGSSGR